MAFNDPDPMRNALYQQPAPWETVSHLAYHPSQHGYALSMMSGLNAFLPSDLMRAQQLQSATSDADYQRRMMAAQQQADAYAAVFSPRRDAQERSDRLEWHEESPSKLWRAWDWAVRAFAAFGVYSLVRVFL